MPAKALHITTRLKMSEARKGKPKSEEHKAKISETRREQETKRRQEKAELEWLRGTINGIE